MELKKNFIKLIKVWKSQRVSDGDGVLLNRVIGIQAVPRLDPFLMLDFIESAALPAGFPDHMHRGFETVTYLVKGKFYHEDFKGNKGELNAGDVQWMTAGKGIVHSEMPASTDPSSGFQLWIDLERANKMCEPNYQEIKNSQIPEITNDNFDLRIISGNYKEKVGACFSKNPVSFFDVKLRKGKEFQVDLDAGMSGFLFVFEGSEVDVQGSKVSRLYAGSFATNKDSTEIRISAEKDDCRFLLIFGKPLNQPVFQRGPVVMCTEDDVLKAFNDYRLGINGFENAKNWQSQIQYLNEKN